VYDDEDTVMNEIDEFYSYIETVQIAENLKVWEGSFPSGAHYKIPVARPLSQLLISANFRMDEGSSFPEKGSC
jgi:hypothetical protein